MEFTTTDHDTENLGLRYVYAVYSRRAGGVSVGVDLNPNHACNWRCIYCQVENLVRGAAPRIDLERLEHELEQVLVEAADPAWLAEHVPPMGRKLADVAIAGNGEPTTCDQLAEVLEMIGEVLARRGLAGLPVVLISNGSQVHKPLVQNALRVLARLGGELWFKIDSATRAGRRVLNDVDVPDERVEDNLVLAASLVGTRIQTMVLALDGAPPSSAEVDAYIALLERAREQGAELVDVMVYGPARVVHQPEAARIAPVREEWLGEFRDRIASTGLAVSTYR